MAYVGGLRARLISDNLYYMLDDVLRDLGWYDPDARHMPVTLLPEPLEQDEEAQPNLVAISEELMTENDLEMGSDYTEKQWDYVIDVYGENAALTKQLATDIYDALRGKFPSIGRTQPNLVCYDLTQATPPEIFTCALENFGLDRSRTYVKSYQRYWWMIFVTVTDDYIDEDD